ncbi:MAG TPA: hypothetical protein VHI52_13970, partial [Verrucomicrobiae bacterium]|nr:hypothetical protein [Verrucomicrobiae bacterium]
LTGALSFISARFDLECNRTLARTVDATYEFLPTELELPVPCYPIEHVTRFEIRSSESQPWTMVTNVDYLVRRACVISLSSLLPSLSPDLDLQPLTSSLCRVTYAGGYLSPGDAPVPGAAQLPSELEHAAIEQIAFWFVNRDKLGEIRNWPAGGNYVQLADTDLLPSVRAILKRHTRFLL